MANRLAEAYSLSADDFSSDDEASVIYTTPRSNTARRVPAVAYAPPTAKVASTFKPGHRRKGSSLSAIAEED